MLEFRENKMFFRTVLKSSNYNYLSTRKVLFSRHRAEVMTEFSAAWCLSIVSQGAKATLVRSLRIVEGSAGTVVATSQIKAVKLDFFSTSNCFSSCFLHAPVGVSFYERCNPFNHMDHMDPLSETDVIQTESPENFILLSSRRCSRYSAPTHWLVHGHMTSNNETVSRQMPRAGNIAKTMTSNGKQFTVTREVLTAVAGISARYSKFALVLFCYITNHLMTGPLGNSEFCFPRISMFPSTSSRETLTFSGNKIYCSPRDQSLSV